MALGPGVRCKPSGGSSRIWRIQSTTPSLTRSGGCLRARERLCSTCSSSGSASSRRYFHYGTSLLCKRILPAVYRSCSFRRKATMLVHTSGHEVGNPYSFLERCHFWPCIRINMQLALQLAHLLRCCRLCPLLVLSLSHVVRGIVEVHRSVIGRSVTLVPVLSPRIDRASSFMTETSETLHWLAWTAAPASGRRGIALPAGITEGLRVTADMSVRISPLYVPLYCVY